MSNTFVKVTELDALVPGTGKVFAVQGKQIALFRVDGRVVAVDNRCPHRGGPLGEGTVLDGVVACPWHGWRFDLDSAACLNRPGAKLKSYPVRIEQDEVLVEMSASNDELLPGSVAQHFLVRFGTMGHVGKFHSETSIECPRGSRVVVQSSRGEELGEVLLATDPQDTLVADQPDSGVLVRRVNDEDTTKELELHRTRNASFETCSRWLAERRVAVDLVDAELLFDGQTLILYYFGDPLPTLANATGELSQQLGLQVLFRPFGDQTYQPRGVGCGSGGEHGCSLCGHGAGGTAEGADLQE